MTYTLLLFVSIPFGSLVNNNLKHVVNLMYKKTDTLTRRVKRTTGILQLFSKTLSQ